MTDSSTNTGQPPKHKLPKAKVAVAVAAAAVLAVSSTFAWTSFSQEATNEFHGSVNPGGRLHDDFSFTADKKNKDIYVENFTDPATGSPIFARVQLQEYLEIGVDAGEDEFDGKNVWRFPEDATMDTTTWPVHLYDDADTDFHDRFTWTTGGQTVFMPTFNKNKDSIVADINGSLRDEGGPYSAYREYTEGAKLTGTAVYDADSNSDDEGEDGEEGVHFTSVEEEHTAKLTGEGTLMSMEQWVADGSKPGPYWVYDEDGWAYWAQAIMPGEATGLLLNHVQPITPIPNSWYYGILATADFVSAGEWLFDGESYYLDQVGEKGITENAYNLLEAASAALSASENEDENI